ncbi:MAG: ribosomal protein S18-alanine N-acetyltransferase [Lachnospiraceae bacterium]|nr:ribosomal protein S18-alanine N-acetyltransferase [Robinsoniella sp.]MDY3767863.1 ribosomal protein S18-alanine N-acetyltransferase [Lachnospiraceae bacterium]
MVEIRQMKAEDLDQVAAIERESFSMPWTRESLLTFLNRGDTIYLVAEQRGEIVGYCGCLQISDEADILNVAVKTMHRGQHVGTKLVQKLIEEGKKRGAYRFTLEVRQSNFAAIHVYEKAGFTTAGVRKNFYEKPTENAVIMWK